MPLCSGGVNLEFSCGDREEFLKDLKRDSGAVFPRQRCDKSLSYLTFRWIRHIVCVQKNIRINENGNDHGSPRASRSLHGSSRRSSPKDAPTLRWSPRVTAWR